MFNTPIVDIAVGLIFVFLTYSLLATSVKEGIATLLALRARMLKKGIITGMLTATPNYTHWYSRIQSIAVGIWRFLKETLALVTFVKFPRPEEENTLGGRFYRHPILKNYGSSGLYPYPSYLPSKNFSLILVAVLRDDYFAKFPAVGPAAIGPTVDAAAAGPVGPVVVPAAVPVPVAPAVPDPSDIDEMRLLLGQYRLYYNNQPLTEANRLPTAVTDQNFLMDEETLTILELHLRESSFNMEVFKGRLEDWFEDSMNRVSGWYKRQVQVILFFLGFAMAIVFNVDTIDVATRLSKDDKLREQAVQNAVGYSRSRKDWASEGQLNQRPIDSATVENKFLQADTLVKHDIHDINSLMSIGYGDWGESDTGFVKRLKDRDLATAPDTVRANSLTATASDQRFFRWEMQAHSVRARKDYIWYSMWNKSHRLLSFFILAFAVCLGAPFWFDMLSKVINIRATGKKEDGDGSSGPPPGAQLPV